MTGRFDLPSCAEAGRCLDELRQELAAFDSLTSDCEPPQALRRIGLHQLREGSHRAAMRSFAAALALQPEMPELWRYLAMACLGVQDLPQARCSIGKALEQDARSGRSWFIQATICNAEQDAAGAERAFREAIIHAPDLADAHFGLGVLLHQQNRPQEAIASLKTGLALQPGHAVAQTCLGHALYLSGAFGDAAEAFENAAHAAPLDRTARQRFLRSRVFALMIDGKIEDALRLHAAETGADAEDRDQVLRTAFSLLSLHGYRQAAASIGAMRLAEKPEDPVRQYMFDVVSGKPYDHAPASYLEAYFDKFASHFDKTLVDRLRYRIPEQLCALVAQHRQEFDDILDLGCGTGLAATLLSGMGKRLTGVDLSGNMLAEAAKRGHYAVLEKAEAVAYLRQHMQRFDLIFVADMLVYAGDLQPFLDAAFQALRPGGILAVSVETINDGDYRQLSSGRFAHSAAYLQRVCAQGFDRLCQMETQIRLEADKPVPGLIAILRRPGE